MKQETRYINTDLDLKSKTPFDTLHLELAKRCCILHYLNDDPGEWFLRLESLEEETFTAAEHNIRSIVNVLSSLSAVAKAELSTCYFRDFNMGFYCGDTLAYSHELPASIVQAVAIAGCSISLTLYPMRDPDGTPKA